MKPNHLTGVDHSILRALEDGPISGMGALLAAIGSTEKQHGYVRHRAARLMDLNMIDVHGGGPGRGNKITLALHGQAVHPSQYRCALDLCIMERLADGASYTTRELRRWIHAHKGYKDATTYEAIRRLAERGQVKISISGSYHGRRDTTWTVQAANRPCKTEARRSEPGFKVITRAASTDLRPPR